MIPFLLYLLQILFLTLGTLTLCGLAVRLCATCFSRLLGASSGTVFDVTAIVGTPVHELGHALMCLVFGHKIEQVKLLSLGAKDGVYGYVNHSYNRKNIWARLGNLFIGVGPIFSGMAVVVLTLWLCFPSAWNGYLSSASAVAPTAEGILHQVFSIFRLIPEGFSANVWRSIIGLLIILSVCLHISLSPQDIKGSLSALPVYLLLALVFAAITFGIGFSAPVLSFLTVANIRLLSLFSIVLAFSICWVLVGLTVKGVRWLIKLF